MTTIPPKKTSLYETYIPQASISGDTINGSKTLSQSNTALLSCINLDEYYFDTIFYMYIYGAIYDAFNDKITSLNSNPTQNTINEFNRKISNLQIKFDNTTTAATVNNKIVRLTENTTKYIITFYFLSFKANWNIINADIDTVFSEKNNRVPVANLALFDSTGSNTHFDSAGYTLYTTAKPGTSDTTKFNNTTDLFDSNGFTKAICDAASDFKTKRDADGVNTYDLDARKQKLYQIIYHILSLNDYNVMGELKTNYYLYALYAYNLTIQITIRRNYLQRAKIYQPSSGSWAPSSEISALTIETETYTSGATAISNQQRPDVKIINIYNYSSYY